MPRDLPESQNFNKELIQRQKEDAVKQKKFDPSVCQRDSAFGDY